MCLALYLRLLPGRCMGQLKCCTLRCSSRFNDVAPTRAGTREPRGAVIVEFDLAGRWLPSGQEHMQQCVAIIETSGGRITRFREYWNPLAAYAPDEAG